MHAVRRHDLVVAHELHRFAAFDGYEIRSIGRAARALAADHGCREPAAARSLAAHGADGSGGKIDCPPPWQP